MYSLSWYSIACGGLYVMLEMTWSWIQIRSLQYVWHRLKYYMKCTCACERRQLWGSNPRPCGMAPWATALDRSAKLSAQFPMVGSLIEWMCDAYTELYLLYERLKCTDIKILYVTLKWQFPSEIIMTLAGLEPEIFGSENQCLIH
jgi:hypothetical protein